MEQKDNSGVLFPNNKKEKETQPDITGKAMVNGVEVQISGWKKKSKNGNEYISLSFGKPFSQKKEDLPF